MPGPAKHPRHLKLIKGTLQKYRDTGVSVSASLPVFDALPPPPRWLLKNAHAVRQYRTLGPILIAHRLLGPTSLPVFESACALFGRNTTCFEHGITPTAAHINTHRMLLGSLGLLAMNLAHPTPTNPFAKHAPTKLQP